MNDEKPSKITLSLKREFSLDSEGKIVFSKPTLIVDDRNQPILKDGQPQYEPGEELFKQEDINALYRLINAYDTTKHPGTMKGYRHMLSIKDKLETIGRAVVKELNSDKPEEVKITALNLTIDEAAWIKGYLETVMVNEYKDVRMHQFEIRTLTSVLDQLQ